MNPSNVSSRSNNSTSKRKSTASDMQSGKAKSVPTPAGSTSSVRTCTRAHVYISGLLYHVEHLPEKFFAQLIRCPTDCLINAAIPIHGDDCADYKRMKHEEELYQKAAALLDEPVEPYVFDYTQGMLRHFAEEILIEQGGPNFPALITQQSVGFTPHVIRL